MDKVGWKWKVMEMEQGADKGEKRRNGQEGGRTMTIKVRRESQDEASLSILTLL